MRFEGERPVVCLSDFWHGFIADPDADVDIYASRGFGRSDFVFQGVPSKRKDEWKTAMRTYHYWVVTDIEWYTRADGTAALCIDIKEN